MQARPWELSDEPSGPTWLKLFRDEPEVEGGARSLHMCVALLVHTFFCDLVLFFVVRSSVAFLEALALLGLPLLKFAQLALLFGFGLHAP